MEGVPEMELFLMFNLNLPLLKQRDLPARGITRSDFMLQKAE